MKKVYACLLTAFILIAALTLSAAAAEILLETGGGSARATVSGEFSGEIKVVLCAYSDTGRAAGVRLFSGDCDALKAIDMTLSVPENGSARLFVLDGDNVPAQLYDKIKFAVSPVSQTLADKEVRLTAEAFEREDAEYAYQWYEDGQALSGETSKVLTLEPADREFTKTYYCEVTETRGSAVSAASSAPATVESVKKEINTLWFGGFPVGSYRVHETVDEMLGEKYGVPVNTNFVTVAHTNTTASTYNAYELFTSDTRSSADVIDFASPTFKKYIETPGVDYAVIQIGRDVNITNTTYREYEIASFRKIAKALSEHSPGACLVLLAPYGHTVGFEEDFATLRTHAAHVAEINKRVNAVKTAVLNDGYITDVRVAPVGDAFEEYANGDAELLKNVLFRPERWASDTAEDKTSTRGFNLANRASAFGAYLSAATVYSAITGESPVGLPSSGAKYYFIDGDINSVYDAETVQKREALGETCDEIKLSLQKAAHRAVFGNGDYPEKTPLRTFTEELSGEYTERMPDTDGYFLNGALSDENNRYYSIGYFLSDGKLYRAGETVRVNGTFDAGFATVKDEFIMPAEDITLDPEGDSPIKVAAGKSAALGSDILVCGGSLSGTLNYKVKYGGVSDSITAFRYGHFLPLNVTLPEYGALEVKAGKDYSATLNGKTFELILPIDEQRSDIVLSWNGNTRVLNTAGLTLKPRDGFSELEAMGFAFFDRGMRFQYEQLGLDRAALTNYRFNMGVLPEFSTMQTFKYLDCSCFVSTVYLDVFGYKYGGNTSTGTMINYKNCRVFYYEISGNETQEEKDAIVADFRRTLEPGDAMVYRYTKDPSVWKDTNGHVMLYMGDGMMLHSTGADYDYAGAKDTEEWQGTVRYESALGLFDPDSTMYLFYNNGTNRAKVRFCILRGLDEVNVQADLTEAGRLRAGELKDVFIERVASSAPGHGVGPDEEVTVTTVIENRGAREKTFTLTDTLPAGLVCTGGEVSPGAVTFKAGEKKTFAFKVKASGAAAGSTLTVSGSISGYPINDIDVYYCKVVSDPAAFKSIDLSAVSATDEVDLIKAIYAAAGYENVTLPEAEDAAQTIFPNTSVKYYSSTKLYSSLVDSYSGSGVKKLIVPGVLGGKAVRLSAELYEKRIRKLTEHQLNAGDVLLVCDSVTENGASDARYYVYLGAQRFAYYVDGAVKEIFSDGISARTSDNVSALSDLLSSMAGHPAYAVLRPSQGFNNTSGSYDDDLTGDWIDD
ncbi:MAG: C40 family peptidase [Clostridia bacterium]|nr:C40 family peptidase [Clostridia bacterium]